MSTYSITKKLTSSIHPCKEHTVTHLFAPCTVTSVRISCSELDIRKFPVFEKSFRPPPINQWLIMKPSDIYRKIWPIKDSPLKVKSLLGGHHFYNLCRGPPRMSASLRVYIFHFDGRRSNVDYKLRPSVWTCYGATLKNHIFRLKDDERIR